jgi:hypothetical protein
MRFALKSGIKEAVALLGIWIAFAVFLVYWQAEVLA